MLTEIIMYVLG